MKNDKNFGLLDGYNKLSKKDKFKEFITEVKKSKKYRKKPRLLKECWEFEDMADFENNIIENKKLGDYIAIYNVPFTMEEYDHDGQHVVYVNRKLELNILVTHVNRYKDMTDIKSIELLESVAYRNDITYLE